MWANDRNILHRKIHYEELSNMPYPKLIEDVIEHLSKLPGIGRRSAERMTFWILNSPSDFSQRLSQGILNLKQGLQLCAECNNLSETELCLICDDPQRDKRTICVVEDHKHLLAIERTGTYKGLYHVILGAISPAEGKGPEDLKLENLINRIKFQNVHEIVIATDPDTEGEMTALHITELLKPLNVKLSRIGLGIPVGSSVEYADISTLTVSMSSRREL